MIAAKGQGEHWRNVNGLGLPLDLSESSAAGPVETVHSGIE